MFVKRRYKFKTLLFWTKNEILFFTVYATLITILIEVFHLKWLQLPITPIGLVGTAVAFMIGFQNNAAYGRIWEARIIWGGIVNASRSFIIQVRDSFYLHTPENNTSEQKELKVITHRHIAWLTALRYAMRSPKSWEASYQDVKDQTRFTYYIPEHHTTIEDELAPYLSEEEFQQVIKATNKPNEIISLQSQHLRKLTNEKKFWDFTFLNLQKILQELTALQGKSERIKNFPYPKQYASIAFHFVHLFMWIVPLAIVPEFAKISVKISEIHPLMNSIFVWFNIPCTVLVIWVFNTMLRIGLVGENPFEGSPNDVPISNISRGISQDILRLINENEEDLPPPFPNSNSIHM